MHVTITIFKLLAFSELINCYCLGYEVRHSEGLRINLDHLGLFNVRQNLNTQAFSFFTTTTIAGSKPAYLNICHFNRWSKLHETPCIYMYIQVDSF